MNPAVHTLEIPFEDILRSLDAMLWVIGPYLDDGSMADHPWIRDLAEAYNNLATLIPSMWKHNYPVIELV